VLSRLLSILGYQVLSAQNGYEGLELLRNNPVELVLTDLEMPGMDGWSLAASIKARYRGTPVVMVTGSDIEEVSERLKSSHIDEVIFKPFRAEDVKETVQNILVNN
jgi:CheY-like chemotaxis protein